jgi:hypothetical protein
MPTQTFTIYEAYANAIQDASLRATFLGKKFANWALSYLPVSNLSVQWGQVGGPGAIEGVVKPGGNVIVMSTVNARSIRGNGRSFDEVSLMLLRPGEEFCFSATNYNCWCSVFVPNEILTDSNESAAPNLGPSCNLI